MHGENSMSKLDNDATRVANIYMELPMSLVVTLHFESTLDALHFYQLTLPSVN